VAAEVFLDTPGAGGSEALVDRERLVQVRGGFAGVAVVEVGVADSFQGAGLQDGHPDVTGEGECLGMVAAGLVGR
jgi:hypothetical protein